MSFAKLVKSGGSVERTEKTIATVNLMTRKGWLEFDISDTGCDGSTATGGIEISTESLDTTAY